MPVHTLFVEVNDVVGRLAADAILQVDELVRLPLANQISAVVLRCKVYRYSLAQHFAVGVDSAVNVESTVEEECGAVTTSLQQTAAGRLEAVDVMSERIVGDHIVQTRPLIHFLCSYERAAEDVIHTLVKVDAVEAVSAGESPRVGHLCCLVQFPLAGRIARGLEMADAVDGLRCYAAMHDVVVLLGHIGQSCTLTRLRHPALDLRLEGSKEILLVVSLHIPLLKISLDRLVRLELQSLHLLFLPRLNQMILCVTHNCHLSRVELF